MGSRRTLPGLVFHSDRGSQYGSGTYRELLREAGMRQSMSARANPDHHAWTESFMGTLKTEMLQDGFFIAPYVLTAPAGGSTFNAQHPTSQ